MFDFICNDDSTNKGIYMTKIVLLLFSFFFTLTLCAQTLSDWHVLSCSGGQLKDKNYYLDYSIGEVSIASFLMPSGQVDEGFLQIFQKTLKIVPTATTTDSTLKVFEFVTPNGDGKNDVFYVNNLVKYPENELLILNKWGDVVYKTSHYTNTWDGGELPDGSYFYVLKILPDSKTLSGGFTLAR
jgi:gliding motility-associated-like protein